MPGHAGNRGNNDTMVAIVTLPLMLTTMTMLTHDGHGANHDNGANYQNRYTWGNTACNITLWPFLLRPQYAMARRRRHKLPLLHRNNPKQRLGVGPRVIRPGTATLVTQPQLAMARFGAHPTRRVQLLQFVTNNP